MRGKWSGAWCEGGDWNLIRFPMEKFGLCWVLVGIPCFFFDWVNRHALFDLQFLGASFTWLNNWNPCLFLGSIGF